MDYMLESVYDVHESILDAHMLYAEIEPRWSRWLPWPGRTAIWWYEVTERCTSGICDFPITHAYVEGGSGGGWFLSTTIKKAAKYAEKVSSDSWEEAKRIEKRADAIREFGILGFYKDVMEYLREGQRQGQAHYNALHLRRPKIATQIVGTEFDPFFDDDRINEFMKETLRIVRDVK